MTTPKPPAADIELARLRQQITAERTEERIKTVRRTRTHLVFLILGALSSVVLLVMRLDVASCTTTGIAPVLAEVTVQLRKLA